jgi:hypothetical protein
MVHQTWSEEGQAIDHDHRVCQKEVEEWETALHHLACDAAAIRNPFLLSVMESTKDRLEIGEAYSVEPAVD